MNKKGFTLIELLAVIVVIAIIALISVPIILGVIEKAKRGALQDSAYGLLETANIYYAEKSVSGETSKEKFEFVEGNQISENKLSYKGKIRNGSLMLYSNGKTAVCLEEEGYVAIKNVNEEKVVLKEGKCQYNVVTEEYETIEVCSEMKEEVEKEKNKCSEEKENLVNRCEEEKTILEEQKNTQKEGYEQELEAIRNAGTAISTDILIGKTAYSKGSLITGTMIERGAITSSINAGGSYTIPAGYHNGSGKITGNSLASQTTATATASNITNGVTAWVNGVKITGTGGDNVSFYNSGHRDGVIAADARVSTTSASYTAGYNKGLTTVNSTSILSSFPTKTNQVVGSGEKSITISSNSLNITTYNYIIVNYTLVHHNRPRAYIYVGNDAYEIAPYSGTYNIVIPISMYSGNYIIALKMLDTDGNNTFTIKATINSIYLS